MRGWCSWPDEAQSARQRANTGVWRAVLTTERRPFARGHENDPWRVVSGCPLEGRQGHGCALMGDMTGAAGRVLTGGVKCTVKRAGLEAEKSTPKRAHFVAGRGVKNGLKMGLE